MKKLALIELETHIEIVEAWATVLKNSSSWSIDFFLPIHFKKMLSKEMNNQTIYWYDSHQESISSFLDKNIQSAVYQLVVFNTMHKNFTQYKNCLQLNTCAILAHNLHFTYYGLSKISFQSLTKKNWNEWKYFLKTFFIGQPQAFFFKNRKYIQWLTLLPQPSLQNFTSITLFTPLVQYSHREENNQITLVVPGEITDERKTISQLITVLEKIQAKQPIVIHLLGKLQPTLLTKIQNFSNDSVILKYHCSRVDQAEFNTTLTKADLLLCPIKKDTTYNAIQEIYGATKLTGNELDCIKYQKVGIFPASYPMKDWENFYYSSFNQLESLLNNLTLEKIHSKNKTLESLIQKSWQVDQIQEKLEQTLDFLTSKKGF